MIKDNKFVAIIALVWVVISAALLPENLTAQDFDARFNDQDVASNHINRGYAWVGRNQGDDLRYARSEFQFVLNMKEDTGKRHLAYVGLGTVDMIENAPESAVNNFLKAIQLAPSHVPAHFNLGAAYYKQGALQKAEQAFAKAIELDPGYGRAHYSLGFVYFDQKRYDLAKKHADKAAELGVPYKTLKERLAGIKQK